MSISINNYSVRVFIIKLLCQIVRMPDRVYFNNILSKTMKEFSNRKSTPPPIAFVLNRPFGCERLVPYRRIFQISSACSSGILNSKISTACVSIRFRQSRYWLRPGTFFDKHIVLTHIPIRDRGIKTPMPPHLTRIMVLSSKTTCRIPENRTLRLAIHSQGSMNTRRSTIHNQYVEFRLSRIILHTFRVTFFAIPGIG